MSASPSVEPLAVLYPGDDTVALGLCLLILKLPVHVDFVLFLPS